MVQGKDSPRPLGHTLKRAVLPLGEGDGTEVGTEWCCRMTQEAGPLGERSPKHQTPRNSPDGCGSLSREPRGLREVTLALPLQELNNHNSESVK